MLARSHGWTPDDAMSFVLTDATPPKPVVRTEVTMTVGNSGGLRITVTAESWVPPYAVADVFRSVRDRIRAGGPKRQPRRARALSVRVSALVAFVERIPGSWEAKRRAWNAENPPAARFNDRANFRRSYGTARRRLDVMKDVEPSFAGA
jgi:hypothetical protein